MKKLILSLALIISLVSASFAESIFAHRFFEIKVDVPVSVSNNIIGLTDVLQKEVVIDLPKIADGLPETGASLRADVAPTVSIGVDIPRGLILGVNLGVDVSAGVGLSKDIFEFLGHGNEGKSSSFTQKTSNTFADVFAVAALDGGWNTKNSKLKITGSAFSALAHFDAGDTYVKVYSQENKSGVQAKVDAKLYSLIDYSKGFDDWQAILANMTQNMGFDLGVSYQRDIFRFLTVGGNLRMPLKPSTLNMLSSVSTEYGYELNLDKMLGSKEETEEPEEQEENLDDPAEEESKNDGQIIKQAQVLSTPYMINRPLKIGVSGSFHPFGSLLTTTGYAGIGVRHPFARDTSETHVYFDYAVSGRLSLWNILSLELSHEYMDEIFKNQVSVAFNIRLVEVDAGVSLQSTSFAQSFTGAGLGAFVTVCVGL